MFAAECVSYYVRSVSVYHDSSTSSTRGGQHMKGSGVGFALAVAFLRCQSAFNTPSVVPRRIKENAAVIQDEGSSEIITAYSKSYRHLKSGARARTRASMPLKGEKYHLEMQPTWSRRPTETGMHSHRCNKSRYL